MGNYRFRLSDLMSNSWFSKLRDMGRTRTNHGKKKKKKELSSSSQQNEQTLLHSHPRKSHHFTRNVAGGGSPADVAHLPPDPPRKSSKQKPRRRPATRTQTPPPTYSVPAGCSCRTNSPPCQSPSPPCDQSVEPELRIDPVLLSQSFDGLVCGCHTHTNPDPKSIIIEKKQNNFSKKINDPDESISLPEIELPPIITTNGNGPLSPPPATTKKEKSSAKEQRNSPSRKVTSPGAKFRMNSPRISSKRFSQGNRRKSVSSAAKRRQITDSLAIVKSSEDPERDFRESMVEMIIENKISALNELEELLACYLSLNTDEYHDLIIEVFKQIWYDMNDIGVK